MNKPATTKSVSAHQNRYDTKEKGWDEIVLVVTKEKLSFCDYII